MRLSNEDVVGSRQLIRHLAVLLGLLVMLGLPNGTSEFNLGLSEDDEVDNVGKKFQRMSGQEAVKPRKIEKKFKFHKIERVYIDDYDNEEEDESDNNDAEFTRDDLDRREYSPDESAACEKVQRSHKKQAAAAAAEHKRKAAATSDDAGEESYYAYAMRLITGGRRNASKEEEEVVQEERKEPTSNIIDWLKWIGVRSGMRKQPEDEPNASYKVIAIASNWLGYLDRWPFNTIIPFGKRAAQLDELPRRSRRSESPSSGAGAANDNEGEPAMSQENFESLLYTLPAFVGNPARASDKDCRNQLQIFQRQLRAHKLWTLQMLDATGKISAGMLRGNLNQYGEFDLCLRARAAVKVTPDIQLRMRGKYCLAHIELQSAAPGLALPLHLALGRGLWKAHLGNPGHFVPRYSVANWGVCVPAACSAGFLQDMLESSLRPYNNSGIEFYVEVNESECTTKKSKRLFKLFKTNKAFCLASICMGALGGLLLLALLRDYWAEVRAAFRQLLQRYGPAVSEVPENATAVVEAALDAEQVEPLTTTNNDEDASTNSLAHEQTNNTTPPAETKRKPFELINSLMLEFIATFSPKQTLEALVSRERRDEEFPILGLLKIFATLMLYVCLKYLLAGHLFIQNRDDFVRSIGKPMSVIVRVPLIYSDILLLIGAFLSACSLCEEMSQQAHIKLRKCLLSKMLRYLPTACVVLVFQTYILPELGNGPLWNQLIGTNARLCEQHIWRNLFFAQNFIGFENTCSPLTIQMAVDFQLCFLVPLFVWLYFTDADACFFVWGAFQLVSVALRYSRTNLEHLSLVAFHGMNISKFYRTANMIYASPVNRATVFLMGIAAGIFYHTEVRQTKELNKQYVRIGSCLAALGICWCFVAQFASMHTGYVYSSSDSASYAAWSPLILSLSLCWFIIVLTQTCNTRLLQLAGSVPVLVLSRITFPLQLATYVVVLWSTASTKELVTYRITDLFCLQEMLWIVFMAFGLVFLIDVPAQKIRRIVLERIFTESNVEEQMPAVDDSCSNETTTTDDVVVTEALDTEAQPAASELTAVDAVAEPFERATEVEAEAETDADADEGNDGNDSTQLTDTEEE